MNTENAGYNVLLTSSETEEGIEELLPFIKR